MLDKELSSDILTQQTPAAETHPAQEEWWTQTGERCPSSASLTQQEPKKRPPLQSREEKTRGNCLSDELLNFC